MDFIKAFDEEYNRHYRNIAKLKSNFLKKYQAIPIGTEFEYEMQLCIVRKVDLEIPTDVYELNPDYDIIYFIDQPQCPPYIKPTWDQKTLLAFLNGEIDNL